MTQSAHPMSDGRSLPGPEKERRIHRGESFSDDDLDMDTSRYTQPYVVQSSTTPALPAEPEVLDGRTGPQDEDREGGEARMSEGKDQSANHTNQDLTPGRAAMPDEAEGAREPKNGPAGQGQHGEEYGVYGRGATEGGRYADQGDSPGEVNPPQRNIAQQDIARKDGQSDASDHADPVHVPPRGRTSEETGSESASPISGMNEVGRGSGGDRFREGESALDSPGQDHHTWVAPRETTWKQNSGAETDFGGMRSGDDAEAPRKAE